MDEEWIWIDADRLSLDKVHEAFQRTMQEYMQFCHATPDGLDFHKGGRLKVFYEKGQLVRFELHRVHFERQGDIIAVFPDER